MYYIQGNTSPWRGVSVVQQPVIPSSMVAIIGVGKRRMDAIVSASCLCVGLGSLDEYFSCENSYFVLFFLEKLHYHKKKLFQPSKPNPTVTGPKY